MGLMKLIPSVIRSECSAAEQRFAGLLAELEAGRESVSLHSLNVSRHEYKRWCELDFVFLSPAGLFVLEIKGGRVACENGVWIFTDRYGKEHRKSEGPFEQARSGMYAIRDYLRDKLGPAALGNVQFGWGVVFPDIKWEVDGPEMPRAVVCDRIACKRSGGIDGYFKTLATFWGAAEPRRPRGPMNGRAIVQLVKALRPNFDTVPSIEHRVSGLERQQVRLTEEQYQIIDALEEAERLICSGGAGTGKSFLALECARRESRAGREVIVVCASPIFSQFLKLQLEGASVDVFCLDETEDVRSSADVMIVDEGQDLLSLDSLQRLDALVKGGLEQGRWRWFMDLNNQAGVIGDVDAAALEYLESLGASPVKLKRNCRNTEPIVLQTQLTTGADIGEAEIKGQGPPVIYCQLGEEDEGATLAKQLDEWVDAGADPADIVVLSTVPISESCVQRLPETWKKRLMSLSAENVARQHPAQLCFSTVADFKGLERRFVAIVDLDAAASDSRLRQTLYVAMSRPRAGLWVAVSPQLTRYFAEVHAKNARQIVTKGMQA